MIIDKIENLELYTAVVPEFAAIAKYLRETDLASLEEGSYEVCPGVKCNVSEYEPYAAGDKWEVHKKYADLHLILKSDNPDSIESFKPLYSVKQSAVTVLYLRTISL